MYRWIYTHGLGIPYSPTYQTDISFYSSPFESKDLIPILEAISVAISINPGQSDTQPSNIGPHSQAAKDQGTTLLTITHRPTLAKFHTHLLQFDGQGGWSFNSFSSEVFTTLDEEKCQIEKSFSEVIIPGRLAIIQYKM